MFSASLQPPHAVFDSRIGVDAHLELKKAVKCASDLFDANIKCLTQLARIQKEKDEAQQVYEQETNMLKRRIESLGSVVESQQYQIDALTKVSALGEVWKGVALDLRLSTTPSAECSDVIDRCCRVMAWISQSCLNTVHRASDRGATHGAEPPDFQLHWFARDVAKQLSAADTALARRAAENKRLMEQLNAVQRRHHATDDEAQKYRHISDQLGMRLEDLSSKSRTLQLYLLQEKKKSKSYEERLELLERVVDDATRDGEVWKSQCSEMSRTLGDMVAHFPACSLRSSSQTLRTARDDRYELTADELIKFALTSRSEKSMKDMKMEEGDLYDTCTNSMKSKVEISHASPSTRRSTDGGNARTAHIINAGGASGSRFTPHNCSGHTSIAFSTPSNGNGERCRGQEASPWVFSPNELSPIVYRA